MSLPWHLEENGIPEAWSISRGYGVEIGVADYCIDVDHIGFQGRVSYANDSVCLLPVDETKPEYFHATMVAGVIIASVNCSLPNYKNLGEFICVSGVAPEASIFCFDQKDQKLWQAKQYPFTKVPEKSSVFVDETFYDDHPRTNIILNISGGDTDPGIKAEWQGFIEDLCKSEHNLIIASMGNKESDLKKGKSKFAPAGVPKPQSCENDIVMSVGGTNNYKENPLQPFKGLDYSKADIFAPGNSINSLYPGNFASSFSGTSASAPIVSGDVALLSFCDPHASAIRIKDVIYSSAQIKPELYGGRLLDILNSLKSFCTPSRKNFLNLNEIKKKINKQKTKSAHTEL